MNAVDTPNTEQNAQPLPAAEIRQAHGMLAERAALITKLTTHTAIASSIVANEMLRPLFSWNPQDQAPASFDGVTQLLERVNSAAFKLFSWNPQDRHL